MHFLLFNFVSSEEKFADAFKVLIKSEKIFFRCSSLNCIHRIWDFSYLDFSPKIICELHLTFADIFLFKNSSAFQLFDMFNIKDMGMGFCSLSAFVKLNSYMCTHKVLVAFLPIFSRIIESNCVLFLCQIIVLLVGAILNAHNRIKMLFYVFQVQNHRLEETCFLTVKQIDLQYEHMQEKDVILHNIFTQSLSGPLNNKSCKGCLPK